MAYRSIFTDSSLDERRHNFEDYLAYARLHGGELLETHKDLSATSNARPLRQKTRPAVPMTHAYVPQSRAHCHGLIFILRPLLQTAVSLRRN